MGQAARAKAAPRKPKAARPLAWRWIAAALAAAAVLIAVLVWKSGPSEDGGPVALTHVHGLGVDPADGQLYVATHDGLYRLPATGTPSLVGTGRQDTMGFTVAGPGTFLASGHPAPGQNGPKHLGLIESTDTGNSWATRSLAGQADFHALRYRHDTVYGYNSTTGQLLTSTDKTTWQTRATKALRDFDVSPTDPKILLATTDTGLQRSTDSGTTWAPAGGPPMLLLAWERADRLNGITPTGDVLLSADGGTSWHPTGKLTGQATAFVAHDGILYAAVHEQGIYTSTNGGATWTPRYRSEA